LGRGNFGSCLRRSQQQANREFKPDFSSSQPLQKLGLTGRATETLLWLAQGKTNLDNRIGLQDPEGNQVELVGHDSNLAPAAHGSFL
jgi:hypothetical protein